MKSTGMIRRIDELGRIVIPKEIRITMGIKEGSPLEIKVNEAGEIVLAKHNMIGSIADYAQDFCEVTSAVLNLPVLICDKEKIIALSGCSKKVYLDKPISPALTKLINTSSNYIHSAPDQTEAVKLTTDDQENYLGQVIYPIVSDSSCEGMVICANVTGTIEMDKCNVIKLVASYLSKQLG